MASASAVGSGKRWASASVGRPAPGRRRPAKVGARVATRRARPLASPRASSWAPRAATRRWRTKRSGSRSSTGGSTGTAEGEPLGCAARAGTDRSPRRWPGRGAGSPPAPKRATSAERGQVRHGADRRRGRSGRAGRGRRGRGSRAAAGNGARKRGIATGRDEDGGHGRRSRAVAAARVAAKRVPAIPARRRPRQERGEGGADLADEDRFGAPERLEAVDLDLERAEGPVGRVGAAGDPRAERGEGLEDGLDGRGVRGRVRRHEGGLGGEPVGAPERHPAADAERRGLRARVDDDAVIPRPAAEDQRPGREGIEARARASWSGRCGWWRWMSRIGRSIWLVRVGGGGGCGSAGGQMAGRRRGSG